MTAVTQVPHITSLLPLKGCLLEHGVLSLLPLKGCPHSYPLLRVAYWSAVLAGWSQRSQSELADYEGADFSTSQDDRAKSETRADKSERTQAIPQDPQPPPICETRESK